MNLYTVILDFRGGTYVAQQRAATPATALESWAVGVNHEVIAGLDAAAKETLVEGLADDEPIPLKGLQSAWCASVSVGGALALVNVIETVAE